ncbi:DUF6912 family protein [Timonella sp. A28]|uniref:DUF6912 family protein n=1 Tax=Timonella sp. A28 TaxID=3442640 RepID=UPI003EBE1256
MRLYVPATLDELDSVQGSVIDLEPRRAHAATPALIAEYEAEGITDLEEVEYGAHLAAADDSLMLIAQRPDVPWQRVVLSVDVPDNAVEHVPAAAETSVSAVDIATALAGVSIVCIHIDEPEAADDIQGVFEGKDDALARLAERDLLWYDSSEIGLITKN